jgi:hypothetical protein
MSIVRLYGVIPLEFLKSFVPLGRGVKDVEVEIEFGNAKSVGTNFSECGDILLVLVAVRAHREALYILKNEAEGSVGFGKVKSIPHGREDASSSRTYQPILLCLTTSVKAKQKKPPSIHRPKSGIVP